MMCPIKAVNELHSDQVDIGELFCFRYSQRPQIFVHVKVQYIQN